MQTDIFIGILSGTSMDALDAVALYTDSGRSHTLCHHDLAYPSALKRQLRELCQPGNNEIERLLELDQTLARLIAQCVIELLEKSGIAKQNIVAIGSHGQTIRHLPHAPYHSSLQIGNANLIAHLTGLTTVADFRRADMAAGGQGAPLVCAFHQHCFQDNTETRAVINVGGISNITLLPGGAETETYGFDIGPGNTLLDLWCEKHTGRHYDDEGTWAATGDIEDDLLSEMLSDSYFSLPHPKSTGIEYFNQNWLDTLLRNYPVKLPANQVQRCLLELTAQTITNTVKQLPGRKVDRVLICGGGAKNTFLMHRICEQLPQVQVQTTQAQGIDPQHVEAAAFAWLAQQTMQRKPGNIPAVTGATKQKILGGIYFP